MMLYYVIFSDLGASSASLSTSSLISLRTSICFVVFFVRLVMFILSFSQITSVLSSLLPVRWPSCGTFFVAACVLEGTCKDWQSAMDLDRINSCLSRAKLVAVGCAKLYLHRSLHRLHDENRN